MPRHVCKLNQPLFSTGMAAGTGSVWEGSQGCSQARQSRFSKASCSPESLACEWVRYVLLPIPVTILGTRAENESFDYPSNLQRQQSVAQLDVTPLLPSSCGRATPRHKTPSGGDAGFQPCAVPDPDPSKDVAHPASPAAPVLPGAGTVPACGLLVLDLGTERRGKGHITGMPRHSPSGVITRAGLAGLGWGLLPCKPQEAQPMYVCVRMCVHMCAFSGTKYPPCTSVRLKADIAFKHSKAHCLI